LLEAAAVTTLRSHPPVTAIISRCRLNLRMNSLQKQLSLRLWVLARS